MIGAVADVEHAHRIHIHPVRLIKFQVESRSTDTAAAGFASSGNSVDPFGLRIVAANDVILGVRDDDTSIEVKTKVFRTIESCSATLSSVPGVAFGARANDGSNHAIFDDAQRVPAALEDVD